MAPITLWYFVSSPPSWAVRMTASILKVPLELKEVDMKTMEQKSPEFRNMNPAGTVPVIKDGDLYLPESHTIMKYLVDKYGNEEHRKLYPSNLVQRSAIDQINFFNAGVAFIRLKDIVMPSVFEGVIGVTPKAAKNTEDLYETLEMFINKKEYVASDELTLADLSIGSTVLGINNLHAVDKIKYPATAAWLDRLRAKPVVQEIAIPGSEYLAKIVRGSWKRNQTKQANQR